MRHFKRYTAITLAFFLTLPAFAAQFGTSPISEQAQLTPSDGAPGNAFGTVAASADTAVVGSPMEDVGSNPQQGAAYVFSKPADGWVNMTQTAELTASDGVSYSYFGHSVSISGDTIAVGSNVYGAVYVFVKPAGGWTNMTETAKLTVAGAGGYLGVATAIDGNTIAAGAIEDDGEKGVVYVFTKPPGGWVTTSNPDAKLTASDGVDNDNLGNSIAIDGDTIVSGAPVATYTNHGPGPGAVYVFVEPAGGWADMTQTAKLTASDGNPRDYFGLSLAMSGQTIVVGACDKRIHSNNQQGAAYVFVEPSGGWTTGTQTARLTASDGAPKAGFGIGIAINGSNIAIGAVNAENGSKQPEGAVYSFAEPLGGWRSTSVFSSKQTPPDHIPYQDFGYYVSLGGNALVIGAPGAVPNLAGSAYIF